jgi:inner membrane protein
VATAFTHAYVGCLLAPLAPAGIPRRGLYAALIVLAVLPDADLIGDLFGIPYAHPLGHRGFTHSLLFAAVAGAAAAWLFRRELGGSSRAWSALFAAFFLATISHGLLDALTDGGRGVGFFVPLSDARFFFPWRPLAVTPAEIDTLLAADIPAILSSELLWVWLPATAVAVLVYRVRRYRVRRRGKRS